MKNPSFDLNVRYLDFDGRKIEIDYISSLCSDELIAYLVEGITNAKGKTLKDCLNNKGYQCDVEGNDFEGYKAVHKIAYNKSYTVSKMYLEESLKLSGGYDLIIDFHRDSISKELSTISHDGKSYAKIMFVVGKSSGKFDAVNQLSQKLSDLANATVPKISRGVYVKKSHYNQGISDNMVLIEVGAQSNTKEEVQATVEIIAKAIGEYLG